MSVHSTCFIFSWVNQPPPLPLYSQAHTHTYTHKQTHIHTHTHTHIQEQTPMCTHTVYTYLLVIIINFKYNKHNINDLDKKTSDSYPILLKTEVQEKKLEIGYFSNVWRVKRARYTGLQAQAYMYEYFQTIITCIHIQIQVMHWLEI